MADISDFLVASPNIAFLIAGCVVAALIVIETVSLFVGHSTMMDGGDIDFNLDLDGNGIPDYLEGNVHLGEWVNPGHVPVTMFLVIFCALLSIIGFSGQWIFFKNTGQLAPIILSLPLTLVPTLALTRWSSIGMAKIIPHDETSAISLESLSGEVGVLSTGPVNGPHDFGVARFADQYGTEHRLLVGGVDDTVIESGASVMLVGPHPTNMIAYVIRKI